MQIQDIIRHIFNYPFPSNRELVALANSRRGFAYEIYSVTYPHDMRASHSGERGAIPAGYIEICCQGWTGDNMFITESEYLQILREHLAACSSPLLGELEILSESAA